MFQIDTSLHWTEHFIKYGFAVLRNQVDRAFTDAALQRVRVHTDGPARELPFDQWTTQNVKLAVKPPGVPGDPLLDSVFAQPNIRHIIDTMYGTSEAGSLTGWDGKPTYQIFLNPFNPDAKPMPLHGGHIDFGGNIIPLFGNAFVIQVALHDTEPMGGNITAIPGSHRLVQKRTIDNPLTQYPYDFVDFPFEEPFEFVAKAGDVFLMHHLSFHTGNPCVGATRKPRIALHCQAQRTTFLTRADPADKSNPPWVRSFALNGFVEDADDEQRYIRFCEAKKSMWGVWASADGKTRCRVYTWVDGCLRSKTCVDGGEEQISNGARFDGNRLTFEHPPATMVELAVDTKDADMMHCALRAKTGGETSTLTLRRVERFTTRMPG